MVGSSSVAGDPELATLCATSQVLQPLKKTGYSDENPTGLLCVDFILTTANTWKTPIGDFTLIIEKAAGNDYPVNPVSFCWNGPVTKVDATHFSPHIEGFVPMKS